MRRPLTDIQRAVYDAAAEIERRYAKPATVRRIRVALGRRSTATIHKHLKAMQKKQYLRIDDHGIVLFPLEPTDLSQYRNARQAA